MATLDITPVLKFMAEKNGSDLFFSADAPIHIEIEGKTNPINTQIMQADMIKDIAYHLMNEAQIKEFETTLEMNFAHEIKEVGRFRVNVFKQRGDVAMVIRHVKHNIPSIDALGLPNVLKELIQRQRGLILLVGSTGSGKSTSLAAMIDYRNSTSAGHILMLEDPIEFVHSHKKSIVDQREIGIDTLSLENGLKNAMRQSPDVLMIGEIRDMDGMKNAIQYAETGHLCLATLHANNANQAIERILSFFPNEARHGVLLSLSLNLVSIVSQRLVPGIASKRVAAVETLINSPYVAELIKKSKFEELKDVMASSQDIGMSTFDQALYDLFNAGKISEEQALTHADSRNDLSLKIRLANESERTTAVA